VSDNVKNVIPDFLGLLKGCIDSNDIPLNVSRSALQGDPNITRLSNYIVKKVAESLKKLSNTDREKYENIWEDIGLFVKYGCVSEPKFDELMRKYVLFKCSNGKYLNLEEYSAAVPTVYAEKLKGKVIYFDKDKSDSNLRNQLLKEDILTIETEQYIDPHFMQHTETQKQGDAEYKFSSVDSEIENILSEESTEADDVKVKDLFQNILAPEKKKEEGDDAKDEVAANPFDGMGSLSVETKALKGATAPAYFKIDEQMKRFQQMTKSMGNQNNPFPLKKTLVVNPRNPLVKKMLSIYESGNHKPLVEKICHHVQDLANISSEGLTMDEKDVFVSRSQSLIEELSNFVPTK
jgi:molecular chaperone HtpG